MVWKTFCYEMVTQQKPLPLDRDAIKFTCSNVLIANCAINVK